MSFQPLKDNVLVQRVKEEEQSPGGIYIPPTAQEKPSQGIVIATGKGKTLEDGTTKPVEVKSGDIILFGKYSGSEISLNGEDYLIMREDDILGIISA